jgi:hypothetical protein
MHSGICLDVLTSGARRPMASAGRDGGLDVVLTRDLLARVVHGVAVDEQDGDQRRLPMWTSP